jgi:hypothetical protein
LNHLEEVMQFFATLRSHGSGADANDLIERPVCAGGQCLAVIGAKLHEM